MSKGEFSCRVMAVKWKFFACLTSPTSLTRYLMFQHVKDTPINILYVTFAIQPIKQRPINHEPLCRTNAMNIFYIFYFNNLFLRYCIRFSFVL